MVVMPAAWADPARIATYHVYAGGVRVIEAPLTLRLEGGRYQLDLSAATQGFLGRLVPWRGTFSSQGVRRGDALSVRTHRSTSTWRGEEDWAKYEYNAAGHLRSLVLHKDGREEKPPIDPKLTHGTADILTATMRMLLAMPKTGLCQGQSDVFDSRRRFGLIYTPLGADELKKSRYTFYQGPTVTCTVEVVPKGGAWHKKPRGWLSIQEQGRKAGSLPTLWVAKVDPSLPPLPVKIRIKTDYGTLFMHLASVE
jgi:hypothetical protein